MYLVDRGRVTDFGAALGPPGLTAAGRRRQTLSRAAREGAARAFPAGIEGSLMNSMDLRNKHCLVYDLGLFTENALRLVRDCASVKYYVPNSEAFPEPFKAQIGKAWTAWSGSNRSRST